MSRDLPKKSVPPQIGSGALWASRNPDAKVGMLEFQGAGLEALRQAMLDSEQRMVLLGARFFEREKRAAETAEATRLRFSADGATLTTIAQTLSDGLTPGPEVDGRVGWSGQPRGVVAIEQGLLAGESFRTRHPGSHGALARRCNRARRSGGPLEAGRSPVLRAKGRRHLC